MCEYCQTNHKSLNKLKKHIKLVHWTTDTTYNCNKCGAIYSRQASLRRHRTFECGVPRKYKCILCPADFKRSDHLQSHISRRHK